VSVYQAVVDPAERNTSHSLMLELVGNDRLVLDVGCASGYLAEALEKNGCLVSGVEFDADEAAKARPFLQQLVVADLNQVDLAEQFPGSTFDTIVFGDVLEHLLDPARVLSSALKLLDPNGRVVISIPNVVHGAVRLSVLQGHWDYRDTGLLDRTHIKFFTLDTLLAMLAQAGLTVADLRSTVADPLATEIRVDAEALPPEVVEWVRNQPRAKDYQYVLSARLGEPDLSQRPEVRPAVTLPVTQDVYTERANVAAAEREQLRQLQAQAERQSAEILGLRRQLLTSRDHAIGTEAQLGHLRAEASRLHQLLAEARAYASNTDAELAKAIADAQNAHVQPTKSVPRKIYNRVKESVKVLVGPRIWALLSLPVRRMRAAGPGVP